MSPRPTRRKVLLGGAGALAALAAGGSAFRALARGEGLHVRTRPGVAFGTTVALTFAGSDPAALEAALGDGFAAIRACEAAASLHRADSALSRLNRMGAIDDPDPHLVALVRFALTLASASDGAFDPTVQPLWPLWAEATARGVRPDDDARGRAVALVGWRDVACSEARIAFARPGMALTLNGILQGYAADLVVAAARARGVGHAFVDTGELGAYGRHPDDRPWRLGGRASCAGEPVDLADGAVRFAATSAGAGTPFSADAVDNHIFDPRTGLSPRGLASVTAFAPSGLIADGLSTAAYVLGAERGQALSAAFADCRLTCC